MKCLILLCLTCVALMGADCQTGTGAEFSPPRWSQFQGNNRKQGFIGVRTSVARSPLLKWQLEIGRVYGSSPVQGPDDTIYIGLNDGDLVAINPDGTEQWRRSFFPDSACLSAPAVADDGSIFLVTTMRVDDDTSQSFLNKISPAGEWLGAVLGGDTLSSASPTIWNNFVLLSVYTSGGVRPELFIFDLNLRQIAQQAGFNDALPICTSSGLGNFLSGLGSYIACSFTASCEFDGTSPVEISPFDNSVAVDDGNATGTGNPIVVVATPFFINAYEFDAPNLNLLWVVDIYGGGCGDDPNPQATPAMLNGGLVVIGGIDGVVRALDVATGELVWEYEAEQPVRASAASFGRQIYVAAGNELLLLEANGTLVTKFPMIGSNVRPPVLSADHAFMSTSEGLHSFTFDLNTGYARDSSFPGEKSSAPAILADGTVVVMTGNGFLRAYSQGVLALAVRYPTVAWSKPVEGGTMSYKIGAPLIVDVTNFADGPFDGEVVFHSDRDGLLCSNQGASGRFSCGTTGLSLGTHVLTAAATDLSSGIGNASITVDVINSAPVVALTEPSADGSYFDHQPIQLSAAISDLDQLPFPDDQVSWSSDRDGDLGVGRSISTLLTLGTHSLTVRAIDELGLAAEQSVDITVLSGAGKPEAEISSPVANQLFSPGTAITFAATVSDPEDGTLPAAQIEWHSNIDGLLGTGPSITAVLSGNPNPCDRRTHSITLKLTDSNGNVTEYTFNIRVGVVC